MQVKCKFEFEQLHDIKRQLHVDPEDTHLLFQDLGYSSNDKWNSTYCFNTWLNELEM